ncbi:TerB family tellurite resistance protein [Methylopila henanensis]|uniref:TerB family tellurite resistance protein n=1 Tax=Methylopila henanensis TaxID=873516 RepID=A0ABW4KAI2_9HYPH
MFDSIRSFMAELAGAGDEFGSRFAASDPRVATAALLVHLIDVDGVAEPHERERLHDILKSRFGLSDAETDELIALARRRDEESVDLYAFTSVLKRALDGPGRAGVVEMMWELVFADGAVHELEDNVVWRVAELLGVSTRERVDLKRRIAARARPLSDDS